MKNILLIAVLALTCLAAKAQETFFPTKEGTVLTYKSFDKKGKETGGMKYTIKQVKRNGSDIDIVYLIESLDGKEAVIYNEEITIQQRGDKLYMDMSNFINKNAFYQNGDGGVAVEVTGNNMELPVNAQPGDMLPDANVEMAMKMGFLNMKMGAQVTDRKLESIEDVNVGAGTFNSYKFTSNVNATVLGMNVKTQSTEWYAKGIGIVKSESYDKKGKLASSMELAGIQQL